MYSIVGIDPGVNGGIAVLNGGKNILYLAPFRPNMTESELVRTVNAGVNAARDAGWLGMYAYMEKVGYIRGDGGQGSFTFGRVDGLIRGAILSRNFPLRNVAPVAWQGELGCLTGGDKNVSKRKAKELFPEIASRITHAVADALLIAEYGRRRVANPAAAP